jgi:sugar phosphate isomerase/epimerase
MKQALSTHLFVNHRCTTALLDRIARTGIPAVEIFCARQHLDWTDNSQIAELAHWFKDADLTLHSLHSPMFADTLWGRSGPESVIRINDPVKARRVASVDEIKYALDIAGKIPFRYLIQHFGHSDDEEYDERKIDAAFSSLEELNLFARHRGVEVLLENIPNAFSSSERLVRFLEITHLELGFCFDVGHAHIMEGVERAFHVMKDRIHSTHVHDNDGAEDKHLFPGVADGGSVPWGKMMPLLRSRPDQFPLLLELKEVDKMARPLDHALRVFEFLENVKDEDEDR